MIVITQIKDNLEHVSNIVNNPTFFDKYRVELTSFDNNDSKKSLDRVNSNISNDTTKITLNDLATKILIKSYENSFSNEWLILNQILKAQWEKFKIAGFTFDDFTIVKNTIAILLSIIMASNIMREFGF